MQRNSYYLIVLKKKTFALIFDYNNDLDFSSNEGNHHFLDYLFIYIPRYKLFELPNYFKPYTVFLCLIADCKLLF